MRRPISCSARSAPSVIRLFATKTAVC
jgi:hypothetical protein